MTHLPTGIVVQCQNERSQHKNRASAMKQLRAKLYEHEMEKKRAEERKLEDTKLEINFGSQIRSYVLAPYRLIKDHRTKLSVGDVDRVLDGDLDALIHAYLVFRKTGKTGVGRKRRCRNDDLSISEAAAQIRAGGLVAFPTETVYGLGANALDAAAVAEDLRAEGTARHQPADRPRRFHRDGARTDRRRVAAARGGAGPALLARPADAGAAESSRVIPDIVTAGLPTVGVRMPKHPMALELIRKRRRADRRAQRESLHGLSPTTAEHVREAFGDSVDDPRRRSRQVGIESTVVSIEDGELKLLRPGMISLGRDRTGALSRTTRRTRRPECIRAITARARACCWSRLRRTAGPRWELTCGVRNPACVLEQRAHAGRSAAVRGAAVRRAA